MDCIVHGVAKSRTRLSDSLSRVFVLRGFPVHHMILCSIPGLHTLDVSSAHFPELWHPEMSADLAKFQSRIVMGGKLLLVEDHCDGVFFPFHLLEAFKCLWREPMTFT